MSAYQKAMQLHKLADNAITAVVVNSWPVLVVQNRGRILAFLNCCPHANAPLDGARVRRGALICPRHGAQFDIETGVCIGGGYPSLMAFQTRVVDGWFEVEVPPHPPEPSQLPVL